MSRKIHGRDRARRGRSSRRRTSCTRSSAGHPAAFDVAVADDGDPLHRRDDLGDAVEPGLAGEAHLGRAAVDGDQRHAGLFQPLRQVRGDDARVVPAEPEFARSAARAERQDLICSTIRSVLSGSHSSLEPPSRLVILSTGQPMLMSTTCAAAVLGPPGRFAEPIDIPAVKLHADGESSGRWPPVPSSVASPREDAFGAEQIRAAPAPRRRARDEAKREVAIAGDGGEQQVGGQADVGRW